MHQHHHPHEEEHFSGSQLVKDIVIGMADGLTVPFALAAGLSGALDQNSLIVTAGLAEIAAGSIAMGLGGYLAGKTEVEHYEAELKREQREIVELPEVEKREVREILEEMGFDENTQHEFTEKLAKEPEKWIDFMMKYELGLEKPDPKQASKSAITIGISYIIGGIVPLLPYVFFEDTTEALIWSCGFTMLSLLIFGYYKSKAIGQDAVKGAFRVLIVGTMAAGAAFGIAKWISG